MSPREAQNNAQPDEPIASLINEYFDRKQAGEELTPESFAAEHPDLTEELRPYLAGLSLLDKVRSAADATVVDGAAYTNTELPNISGYELQEELGRGGMGVVYKALQVSTKRVVALKVMLAGQFASQSALRRFDREVELAARLQHPGVVRVLESGEVAGQKYYAMDYVGGERLDRFLETAQPDVPTTLGIVARVCQAVDYAHQHGVIHRDLKPANVLVGDDGDPHILDFGLAKATDQVETKEALTTLLSTPGQVMGTLFYLSPEQAAGRDDEINVRTDVYALGVVLFEALTGSLPFDTTGRPSEILERIVEAPPVRPSSLSNRVDSEIETIILKALEKDQAARYQSAGEMGEDIQRYLEGEPILAKRRSGFYVLRKKVLKHRQAAVIGVAAVIVGLVLLSLELSSRRRDIAAARREALICQRSLEVDADPIVSGAEALFAQRPRLPEVQLVLAQAQYRNESTRERGILSLERWLERDPSRWHCRALLAELYRATGNAERAEALQARADHEAPDTAEAWYLRSFATLDQRRALQCAQESVKRQPSHRLAWSRLAWLRLQTGDLDGAMQGADKLIELGEDPPSWMFFKGQVLARQGRFRQAVEQYTRVLAANPEDGGAHLYRAHAYRRLKEYENAVADYTTVVNRRTGTTPEAWHLYQRATPLWILGRAEEALEDYRQVRVLLGRPFFSDARRFLILRELGRRREADEVLDTALREVQDPWLDRVFRCLAGRLTPEELVADAIARDNREQLCEAYYYAGEVCLLSDQRIKAYKWFEKCVRTHVEFDPDTQAATPMNEYELAEWRLDFLFRSVQPSPSPKN